MTIDLSAFAAVLFDLDGVITRTAELHAAAWKKLFDEFLAAHATRSSVPFVPFDIAVDYRAHVDGKPRRAGVRDFLTSRDIRLPEGTPHDEPSAQTVHELGKRKDRYFLDRLEQEGVVVYRSAIALVREARAQGVKTAVVSSSRNTATILRIARLTDLFQVRVDGVEASRIGLAGKPDPAMFLGAARRLGVAPARGVVFEDATAGVEAGRRGGFGLVVGVGDGDHAEGLRQHGAHVVVADLEVRTHQSEVVIAQAARLRIDVDGRPVDDPGRVTEEPRYIARDLVVEATAGRPVRIGKTVALHTSRDRQLQAREAAGRPDALLPLLVPRAARAVRASRLPVRRRDDSEDHQLLTPPQRPRLVAEPGGRCLGAGPGGSTGVVGRLHGRARDRRRRDPGRDHARGDPARRHGGHVRRLAALLHGHRAARRRPPARSAVAGGARTTAPVGAIPGAVAADRARGPTVRVQAMHCVAPAIRVVINGKTYELAAAEHCAVELI